MTSAPRVDLLALAKLLESQRHLEAHLVCYRLHSLHASASEVAPALVRWRRLESTENLLFSIWYAITLPLPRALPPHVTVSQHPEGPGNDRTRTAPRPSGQFVSREVRP